MVWRFLSTAKDIDKGLFTATLEKGHIRSYLQVSVLRNFIGVSSWIHISHLKKASPSEWTATPVSDIWLPLTKTSTTRTGQEEGNI